MVFPRRYVQGIGVLADIGTYVSPLGNKVLVIWGQTSSNLFSEPVMASFKAHNLEATAFIFSGESDRTQIQLGIDMAKQAGAKVVAGIGGGKAIDVAKAVAWKANAKLVTAPTIASNDAPTSSATVYYTENHIMDGWEVWPGNPDVVLVDTQVIANAPVRWLVSGMGDGLSTWFEAEAAYKGRRVAISGGVSTLTAYTLARLCYDTLITYGVDARRDVARHLVTPAVDRVIEANTLLSGLGFESSGVCTAHAVGNGLTMFADCHDYSHGEKVAFGTVAQLCLDEDIDPRERIRVVDWMIDVGLPVTFEDLNLDGLSDEAWMKAAASFVGPGSIAHNHVFPVTPFEMFSALLAADELGKARKALKAQK
jgi:glycerol dehydrogenase